MKWILSFFFVIGVLAAGVVGYGAWSFYAHPASEPARYFSFVAVRFGG